MLQDKIFKLKGKVQNYAWGGTTFIPQWLGIDNPENKPFAEYWMGAHPSASSTINIHNEEKNLYGLIQNDPDLFIGKKTNKAFGELPYLFKILDVKDMLSIQVHPSKEAAAKGFDEEEANNILITASNRNYKDKNHKPEVMVALSEFWLLHGFLAKDKLLKVLQSIPEFNRFEKIFLDKDYKGLYEHIMLMPQEESDKILSSLIDKEIARKKNNELTKADAGWWVAKLYENEKPSSNFDRGIFSIYLFNKVRTEPGEAVFQGAGVPHAYLEGQNVELMANSDNVLRGGLTPKHIDVPELLKHIAFEGIEPDIMKGTQLTGGEINYPCPVKDFGISKIELNIGETYTSTTNSLEIIVVIEGEMQVAGTNNLSTKKGEAVALLPAETYSISTSGKVYAYKAFVP
jgi:mannose-6-phosphate isomerase